MPDNPLRKYRLRAGLTQQALAEKAGIHWRLVQKYEAGESSIENMTLLTAVRLADALGIAPQDLLPVPEADEDK